MPTPKKKRINPKRVMAHTAAEKARGERREQVGRMYANKMTEMEIAAALGVSQGTVSQDIKALRLEWKARYADVWEDYRRTEMADLDEMDRQCAGHVARTQDSRWMAERLKVKKRKADMLGLDAPTKLAPTDPSGTAPYEGVPSEELLARLADIAKQRS